MAITRQNLSGRTLDALRDETQRAHKTIYDYLDGLAENGREISDVLLSPRVDNVIEHRLGRTPRVCYPIYRTPPSPTVYARASANYLLPINTAVLAQLDTAPIDPDGRWDTANYWYTAPFDEWRMATAALYYATATPGDNHYYLSLLVSGAVRAERMQVVTTNAFPVMADLKMRMTTPVELRAGDTVSVMMQYRGLIPPNFNVWAGDDTSLLLSPIDNGIVLAASDANNITLRVDYEQTASLWVA